MNVLSSTDGSLPRRQSVGSQRCVPVTRNDIPILNLVVVIAVAAGLIFYPSVDRKRPGPLGGGGGDGQEKGKKKASDGRHDVRNPDRFNGPLEDIRYRTIMSCLIYLS
jgi:hypothetical protein